MEPIPGRHPDSLQPVDHEERPKPAEQTGVKLEKLGDEIEEGVADLAGGVGQLALGLASMFARVFGVNPDNSLIPPKET